MENVAAIDIGSNAIRLIVGEYDSDHATLRVLRKIREPIRLGKDVFSTGSISDKTSKELQAVFARFRDLVSAYSVRNLKAVGTSALREAKNRTEIVHAIKQASGISVAVIDGLEEARLIHEAVAQQLQLKDRLALLVDIGGGSVEITVSQNGHFKTSRSFELGTVRILQKMEELKLREKNLRFWLDSQFPVVHDFLKESVGKNAVDLVVGTGGNMEFMGKLRVQLLDKDTSFIVKAKELWEMANQITPVPLKERPGRFNMRADRADVFIPAVTLVTLLLEHLKVPRLVLPAVGLKDGLLLDTLRGKSVRSVLF